MTAPGADELRMRYLLRRLGVGPDASPEDPMPENTHQPRPVTPTRVIPAGQPWPPIARPLPPGPPGPGAVPPWRTAPAAPPPPPPVVPPRTQPWPDPPPPGPVEVRVTVDLVRPPEPEPSRWRWDWLTARLRPWASLISAVVVLGPWFGGHSIAGAWSATLHEARTEAGLLPAYLLAIGAGALVFFADDRRPRWWTRGALIVGLVGGTGAMGWYDPVTLLTGVRP
ncbi:hypothetical protein [Streptomyces paromomycinus]|uniref:Uncharacterized protein n=1 Tax=Streptomyces paromomycinus TaxID=92743 RepID=A0A401WA16_STREY|nr:hypothetical protein [Streptomyces paromomycinus]GCD46132.1 hypothetical protein GKJPGBOP_05879 [Streptomyces paromomycinus]